MKNRLSILFFFILITNSIHAQQRFKAGLKAGISTSQVAGDTYAGFNKAGVDGGAYVRGKLNNKWSAQMEIIYIQKGSKHNYDPEKGDMHYYFLQLDYIEVPLLFQFHQKKFTFELGPGYSYLLKEEEFNEVQELTGIYPFNKKEISINVGINYTLYKNWGLNWRYTNSVSSIRDFASGASTWYNPGERNNVLAFTLTYIFGHAEE